MKNLNYLFALLFFGILGSCQKDLGEFVYIKIDTPSFLQIRQDANVDIILSQGPGFSVEYEGYDLVFSDLDFHVLGNKLIISQRGHYGSSGKSSIYITVPDLSLIESTSSGDIYTSGRFAPKGDLEIYLKSSGDMDLNLDVPELWTTIYGSGDLRLSGYADFHTIDQNNSGYIYAFSFNTNATRITHYGSGRAEVYARHNLYARVRSSGSIYFIGNPFLDYFVTGSGSMIDAN